MELKKKFILGPSGYALKVSLVYIVFGVLWILVSGEVLHTFIGSVYQSKQFETYKGILFILVTGSLLFVLIRSLERTRESSFRRSQNELSESNKRFDLIAKATNDAVWDWNLRTNEIWWNEGFSDIFGYNKDEIENGIESWKNRIHPDDFKRVEESIQAAIDSVSEIWFEEYRFLKKDGTYAFVFDRGYIVKDASGLPCRMAGSMIDISLRKKMEADLRASEEKWRSIFENSPSWIITMDRTYSITSINRLPDGMNSESEVQGKSVFDFVETSEKDRLLNIYDSIFTGGKAASYIVKSRNVSGGMLYYSVQAVPQIKHNRTEQITLIATDITEKIEFEEKLKVSNTRLHELAAHLQTVREEERIMISREIHDQLGQELTALKMDISFLAKRIANSKNENDIQEINKSLASMSEICDQTINSIRRIARELRPDLLDKLGLVEALEWHAEEFSKRSGILCRVSVKYPELKLSKDLDTTIFRIVQESLTNVARHSGAKNAEVDIDVSGNVLFLSISDNGRGITEEEIELSKSLGLVGIKERVYSAGGIFRIEGSPGKGTRILITIPVDQKEVVYD